jgi:stage IV sporulation protein B
VFGALSEVPRELSAEQFPAKGKGFAHNGKAYIYTTVDGEGRQKYEVNISAIDENGSQKNFIVEITDVSLLSKTGGIVQGMSGSPIIQDGKLVGAITHVLVNDPTRGYGIFIENMLEAVNIPMKKAS